MEKDITRKSYLKKRVKFLKVFDKLALKLFKKALKALEKKEELKQKINLLYT